MWITKQDVGTESYSEKEKGQASDSFKRACFNFGIGRELYTAPFIWVSITKDDLNQNNKIKTQFKVDSIGYNEKKEINSLVIVDNKGNKRYEMGKIIKPKTEPQKSDQTDTLAMALQEVNAANSLEVVKQICDTYRECLGKNEAFIKTVNNKVTSIKNAV